MAEDMIGSITCTPPQPRPGECVEVQVLDPDGRPLETTGARVAIRGLPGDVRYLQFAGEGTRRVTVTAERDGRIEQRTVHLEVAGQPLSFVPVNGARPHLPLLRARQSLENPYEVELAVGLDNAPEHTAGEQLSGEPRYEWDFGDGSDVVVTRSSVVRHDFFAGIDHVGTGIGQFHVRCAVAHAGVEVARTLTVHSAYHLCRRRGTAVPHVKADVFAHKVYTLFAASFTVFNVEDGELVLDRMAVAPLHEDPDALVVPPPFTPLRTPVTVSPGSSAKVGVHTPIDGVVPAGAPGFTVWYAGHVGELPVRLSATFDVPLGERATPAVLPVVPDDWARPWPWDQLVRPYLARVVPRDGLMGHVPLSDIVLDVVTGTLAVDLKTVSAALAPPQARAAVVRVLDAVFGPVRELEQQRGSGSRPSVQALIGPRSVAEGSWCDPENITDEERAQAEAGQLVCMLTDDTEEVKIPERFLNALKGDLVISPGGTGLIGGMMRQVSLPQKYSHSGIMTRNYQEVTHSTASEERLLNNAGSDGFDPEVLKYLWPGVVTQGVGAAIHGEDFISPEGMPYSISSFEPHQVGASFDGNFEIVPPLVVKPDPEVEDVAVRQALRDVAEQARAAGVTAPETHQSGGLKQSKSHYRFYCYTNAEIGLTEIAPPEAGWAAGTFPTVCSSFIWLTHRKAKTRLEGPGPLVQQVDLEPKDVETGAQVRHDTVDGLYEYTAAERLKAGQWLHDTIYNLAYDDAGWFGVLLTDAADDIANQLLNAFANDGAGGKDSELWRTTGDANAVSPDDLLWWDGPDTGGLYGHAEPVQYRAARTEVRRISRWQKVLSRGTVRGRVLLDGKAVAGAHVELPGGAAVADKTDADGAFEFADVPFGEYALTAWRVVKGVHHSAEVEVVHEAEDTELGDLVLNPPPEQFRLAQVHLDFWGSDHESAGDNETYSDGPRYHELDVSPDKPVNKLDEEYKWGGEMRVEYEVVVQLADDKAISVAVHGKLYEDTTESGDDLDHTGSHSIVVPEGEVRTFVHKMHNSDEDVVQDRGELTVKVVNAQNHA